MPASTKSFVFYRIYICKLSTENKNIFIRTVRKYTYVAYCFINVFFTIVLICLYIQMYCEIYLVVSVNYFTKLIIVFFSFRNPDIMAIKPFYPGLLES